MSVQFARINKNVKAVLYVGGEIVELVACAKIGEQKGGFLKKKLVRKRRNKALRAKVCLLQKVGKKK